MTEPGSWSPAAPCATKQGQLQGGVVVFHDITRRKKSERRLAAQYETTRVLAEAESPDQATSQDSQNHL